MNQHTPNHTPAQTNNTQSPKQRLHENLRSLTVGYPVLCLIVDRKASVTARQSGHGTRSIAPIPLNIGAWQLKQDIDQLARTLVRAASLNAHHGMGTVGLLKGVIANEARLLERKDFPAIVKLVADATVRLERVLDPPPDTKMVGWCPSCNAELRCTELELPGGYVPCPKCRSEWRIKEIHRLDMLRLRLAGARGTASAISRLLAPWGIDIKAKTISKWGERGILAPVAVQDGRPVFLVWDVWEASERKKNVDNSSN